MLNKNLNKVLPKKKNYLFKNYTLFCILSKSKSMIKNLRDTKTKIKVIMYYVPSFILALKYKMRYKKIIKKEGKRLKD